MAAAEQTEQHEPLSDNHRALVSATAAVAGAAASYALRKALKREQPEDEHDQEDADDAEPSEGDIDDDLDVDDDAPEATIGSVSDPARSSAWQSASATVLPLAEHVARAADAGRPSTPRRFCGIT